MASRKQRTWIRLVEIDVAQDDEGKDRWLWHGEASRSLEGVDLHLEVQKFGRDSFESVCPARVSAGRWSAETAALVGMYRVGFGGDERRSRSHSEAFPYYGSLDDEDGECPGDGECEIFGRQGL